MELELILSIDDDALGGRIDIDNKPYSYARTFFYLYAPGSLVSCFVEYIRHGVTAEMCITHRRYDGIGFYFCDRHVVIEVERRASFTVPRGNIRIDMSTPDGEQ